MNQLNSEQLHTFFKGWKADFENHAETPDTMQDAWNGYLSSENGKLSYTNRQGTRLVYNNPKIKKYLGFFAFMDELFVLVKGDIPLSESTIVYQDISEIVVDNFEITSDIDGGLIVGVDFPDHFTETIISVPIIEETIDENDFSQTVSCADDDFEEDPFMNNLFASYPFLPTQICEILSNDTPINNVDYPDAMITFKYDQNGMLVGTTRWVGNLNIPMDAKIATFGVHENQYYKRVYFADFHNVTRVVNLNDKKLSLRNASEFGLQTTGTVLSPRINSVRNNGQLKAQTAFYAMRLVTENGQVSDYSPTSPPVRITVKDGDYDFEGGSVSELTNKSVLVDCYIPDWKNFSFVELIAIEYQAKNIPTLIRLVGRKPVAYQVQFEHFGSEPEYTQNITLADIFANSISWKYNSDFADQNNKLLVCGLRNDPTYVNSKNVSADFALHGFKPTGETHHCLLNPDPIHYNYINVNMTDSFLFTKRKLFRSISIFGSAKIKLINQATGDFFETTFLSSANNYVDRTAEILTWLLDLQSNEPNFATYFPNLTIGPNNGHILFSPTDALVQTDMYGYSLTFGTPQVIMDMDNDLDLRTYAWPTTDSERELCLVYGGVSNGWFRGNGVRVTMHSQRDKLISKNSDWMGESQQPLNIYKPTLNRYVMKGEIYRLAIQWYKNGQRLFNTVLGDMKIPDIGMVKRELDENGQIITGAGLYSNKVIIGDDMYGEGIMLQFDVRINCELSKEVDAYQIVYVERTENNRTILAQGIAFPTERVIPFVFQPSVEVTFNEQVLNKWILPSHGGPVYDAYGLKNFDNWPNNTELGPAKGGAERARVTTHRKLVSFDNPDLIYGKVSDQFIESCVMEYVETVTTDHDRNNIITGYDKKTSGSPGTLIYDAQGNPHDAPYEEPFGEKKFSQKIPLDSLAGENQLKPGFVNASIFANSLRRRSYGAFDQELADSYKYEIDKTKSVNEGQILSAFQLGESFDVSNNALTLASHGWFYQFSARKNFVTGYSLFNVNNFASGRETVFIKTKENFFSDENIVQTAFTMNGVPNIGLKQGFSMKGHDAHIVANLKRNNAASVYGGRSEYAYASNEYIAMSEVMPVISNRITSQMFYVQGDTYCTLFLHNKTSYRNSVLPHELPVNWPIAGTAQYNKYHAWAYGVVLETTIEPRLGYADEFYRRSKDINFKYELNYNKAYSQENDLRKSIPKPLDFKDDPDLNNIVAASKVKLSGDTIDSWTQFPTNEFYELDKNMGSALNMVKEKETIVVVQEMQTSQLFVDQKSFITPDNGGEAIQVNQGNGSSISGHQPISNFGTSFRRALVKNGVGFCFYDERKYEFVKINKGLFTENHLGFKIRNIFQADKVIDVEAYYDEKFKESNIRFRTAGGQSFIVSYNEELQCFNGRAKYENDIFMPFQETVLAPYADSQKLGQLNTGNQLEFFEVLHDMLLSVVSSPNPMDTKINKGIAILTNIDYPIKQVKYTTSLGHQKVVMGDHHWYKIREGVHTIPSKNMMDLDDIRGEWCEIEIVVPSINNKKINLFGLINFFRKSHK